MLPALTVSPGTAFGVYIHVPFCATRCGYCDFNTYTAAELGPATPEGWLTALRTAASIGHGTSSATPRPTIAKIRSMAFPPFLF